MKALVRFYHSTVGKKVIMAITGIVMVLFVIGHMAGNLKAFGGFDSAGIAKLDHYAEFLRTFGQDILGHGGFLWVARLGLLFAVVLHFTTAFQLVTRNRAARTKGYAVSSRNSATWASLSMSIGGVILLLFIIFHILHFTTGHLHMYGFEHGKVYANIYSAFKHPAIVCVYVIAMIALCLHLSHGVWSVFQTLGIDSPGWNKTIRLGASLVSLAVAVGFVAVPLAIYFKVLPAPPGELPNVGRPEYYISHSQ